MNAKKRLCELLDERGEGYVVNDFGVTWKYYSDPHTADVAMDGTLIVTGLTPEQAIAATVGPKITEDTSDGWHTFKELYHHRALLFSVIVHNYRDMCWKSKKHDDGTELDWNFIVGIDTPWGQASYHYGMDYWDMFDCKVLERAPKYDGYTPEQSVERIAKLVELDAATVGVTEDEADARDLMEAIRDDDGVRYSMDEVMDIMGKDVAAKVGNAQEPSNAVIERIERFCTDYAQCLVDATLHDKRPFDAVDHRACGSMAVVEANLIRELAEDVVTAGNAGYGIQFADWCEFPPDTMVGETVFDSEGNAIGWIADATTGRSCASCPEMDNPDSYISHLQAALKWHDEHVPRPTNPRNTCVVLKGQNPPDEVLFVHDEGGVTHYLPEVTCKRVYHQNRITKQCTCSNCGYGASDERWAYCPKCGHKYVHGEVEERWKRAGRKVAE